MHKYIIVRVFSHKTKEMTLSPMTETKSPNSALECFPKFSQKCRACVKIFLVGWEFISPKYMILYVNIVVLFTGCDFIDELPLKKGNMLCKIQPGSGLFTNLSILHCIDFLPQWKKKQTNKTFMKEKNSYDKVAWTLRPVPAIYRLKVVCFLFQPKCTLM